MLQTVPKVINSLIGVNIVEIGGGNDFSFAITDTGTVYSWGKGDAGNLGHGDVILRANSTIITSLSDKFIIKASGGEVHSLFLSKQGIVYSVGTGDAGQLGLGSMSQVLIPTRIESTLNVTFITDICAGARYSLALNRMGYVFSWGSNGVCTSFLILSSLAKQVNS